MSLSFAVTSEDHTSPMPKISSSSCRTVDICYNYFDKHTVITSDTMLPNGKAMVEVDFAYHGGGAGKGADITLKLNNKVVGTATVPHTVPARFGIDSFGIGEDSGQPVSFLE